MTQTGGRKDDAVIPRRVRKCLRDGTVLSVAEIEEALRGGRVELVARGQRRHLLAAVDGRESEEQLVYPDDLVLLDGQSVSSRKRTVCYVLNKPPSVTTTTRDPRGKRDLGSWLQALPRGVFPIGRLDRATTGALVLSNDGDLASAVLRPEHHLQKLYWLWVNDCVPPDDPRLHDWLSGMMIKKHLARADGVEVLDWSEDSTELLVTLSQGINRQIRRMSRKSDFRLLHLHRRAVGPVSVRGLSVGELRELGPPEIESLWAAVGGRESVLCAQLEALQARAERRREESRPDERLESWLESNPFACQTPSGERGLD